ncbi:hypothetical protein GOP47_0011415 [Adiantum capillus-veneris]|uniref:Alpha-1,4 glucan phosphorylase n=1 Tax=Adiantum capillus-veneris TaxID=13818 RepID=A0A9D4ZGQ3_ADICA|nr:hypothetical protein GOP47_0011415 [Adiantum capillus-veneris]
MAKRIVQLVTDVGAVVNNDPDVGDLLKVVFIPNWNVTVAELAIPGSELSQHISTAGMEASGTTNVEIREEIGEENFFLFGARADDIVRLRKEREQGKFTPDPRFQETQDYILSGVFGSFDYQPLIASLEGNSGYGRRDYFLVGYDLPSYLDAKAKVDEAYKDRDKWTKMSILSTACSGKFSSDGTIRQYAKDIWHIEECQVP